MGMNMVERLLNHNHEVVAYDVNTDAVKEAASHGATPVSSIEEMVKALPEPRHIWVMVPNAFAEDVMNEIMEHISAGDTIIDGGNSYYKDSERRAGEITDKGFKYLGIGVSGGPKGAKEGACLMIGGDKGSYEQLVPLFKDLAAPEAFGYFGEGASGHFSKMVHNGIEYGMMQAIGEGFEIMRAREPKLDLREVARVYNHQSVITSRLVGWLESAFDEYGVELDEISGTVGHKGEGKWTVEAGKELGVDAPIIEGSFNFRIQSKDNPSYTGKVVSALRNQFGGHQVKKGQPIDDEKT